MSIQIKTKSENYPIKILLSNFLKSQNLYVVEDTLFQSINNSCITIINDTNKSILNKCIDDANKKNTVLSLTEPSENLFLNISDPIEKRHHNSYSSNDNISSYNRIY